MSDLSPYFSNFLLIGEEIGERSKTKVLSTLNYVPSDNQT
jgi:hypothetical protein